MSKKYNGHPSRALWNVALWFGNDEGLYNMAREHMRRRGVTKDQAAANILADLKECGITETPDGVKYNKSNVRYALRGL